MKQYILIFSTLLFTTFASAQKFTRTNQTLPFFTEKNQWQASVLYHYMPEVHLTYALGDHFRIAGVFGHGSRYKNKTPIIDSVQVIGEETYKTRRTSYQLELGWYKKLKKRSVLDLSGGLSYGYGHSSFEYNYVDETLDYINEYKKQNQYYEAYVQPSIGFHGKHFGYGFGFKASYLLVEWGNFSSTAFEAINEISFGWEQLRFDLQLGIRLLGNFDTNIGYRYVHFGGGMSYRFNKKTESSEARL